MAGNVYTSWHGLDLNLQRVQEVNPQADIVAGPAPAGPGGRGYTGEGWPWVYVIPKSAAFPEDCVRVIDFFFKPEIGAQILCEGQLGVTNKGLNTQGWCEEFSRAERLAMGEKWNQLQVEAQPYATFFGLWMPMSWIGTTAPYPHMPEAMQAHFEQILANKYSEAALNARGIAQEYLRISAKKRPVAADQEHWPNLQTRFSEFISQAVAGAIVLDQGWDEWLDFFARNGGPTITEQVNAL
jgi:ABC-type glycerol-3-phosphate transport system substrate-binding protein